MRLHSHTLLFVAAVGVVSATNRSIADEPPASAAKDEQDEKQVDPKLKKELFTGKVLPLRDALKQRGVKAFSEFDNQVALETQTGELIPIVPDWRGRAFYQDKRLRNRKVELVGYRRPGIPYLQVLMVFTFNEKGERQYTDYWCDICSIPMYEIKPCDCCQDDIRIRFQPGTLPTYILQKPTERLKAPKTKTPNE